MVIIGQTDLSPQILVPKRFPVPAEPKNQNWATKKKYHLGITLKIPETLEFNLGNVIRTRYAAPKFGPKKVPSTKKVLCHAQNPNFQLSLGFYLDTDQILKVWSSLDKRISLRKFWSQKGFQYLQSPKIKIGNQKKRPPGDNPKDSRNTGVQLRKCHKDKICCPKVCDRQTTDRHSQILAQLKFLKVNKQQEK